MTEGDAIAWLSQRLEERVGLRDHPTQRGFVKAQLKRRLYELGLEGVQAYVRYLLAEGEREWRVLYDRLAIHESRFFRHRPSFSLIEEVLLPRWRNTHRPIRVWSVGCARGEEPYSLAMTLYAPLKGRFCVFANDISLDCLRAAKAGLYPRRRLEDVPWMFRHHFHRTDAGLYRLAPKIRQGVAFFCANVLARIGVAVESMDLIVCQHLLTYLRQNARLAVLARLTARLRKGGSLVLSPGEVASWCPPGMSRIPYPGTLAFRKEP
ncbi:MAG: hypothetical protein D6819_00225 [Gammaproteobacteria bacterium]|nr:MAG: hypothetical protein D6819_00225 [Gammaproteobacteria bacterium]